MYVGVVLDVCGCGIRCMWVWLVIAALHSNTTQTLKTLVHIDYPDKQVC